MAANSMMMIHNPHGMAVGDANEMQRVAALLQQVKGSLSDTYAARTGQQKDQLNAWMDDETWMSAETAVQYGFADAVTDAQQVSASFNLLKNFRNVPDALRRRMDAGARPMLDKAVIRIKDMEARLRA